MDITHTTDLILLHRWRASRDAEAFRALAERYAGLVFAAAHRVLRDPSEAEDVAQECFLNLAQARKPPERNLGAWLHAAAVNRAKNHIRGEVRRRQREQHYDALQPDRIQIELDDTLAHVDEAISVLDDELRHVIIAHFLEAKSQGEIADSTGVSRQTVNARVKRGVEAIRAHLAKKGITATTASLTTLLGSQMVEAAPATLVAALGKVALSGGVAAGVAAMLSLKNLLLLGSAAALAAILSLKFVAPDVPLDVAPRSDLEAISVAESPVTGAEPPLPVEPTGYLDGTTATENLPEPDTIPLENGQYLTGIVVDESGQPVARRAEPGAVRIHAEFGNHSSSSFAQEDSTFDYRYLELPSRSGVIAAWVPELNLVSDPIPFTWTPGQKSELKLVVRQGTRMEGKALFADGSPIADAALALHWIRRDPFGMHCLKTDAQGQFRIGGLLDGEYTLEAQVEEGAGGIYPGATAVVHVPPGQSQVNVALHCDRTLASVSGRVVDDAGAPIEGAVLSSSVEDHLVARFQAKTGPDGRFQVPIFTPGESKIELSIDSRYVQSQTASAGAGELNFFVGPSRNELRVQAVNASNGDPITKYIIRYAEIGSKRVVHTRPVEDSTGQYITGYDTSGVKVDLSVTVLAPGLGIAEKTIHYDPNHVETHIMEVTAGERRRGRVRHADGQPAHDVSILPPDHDDNFVQDVALAVTDSTGTFELPGIPSWVNTVVLLTDTGLSSEESLDVDTTWDFVLPEPGEISGQITSDKGDLLKGCGLSLLIYPVPSWPKYGIWLRTSSDELGKFVFTGLGEGTGKLFVNLPDGPSQEADVEIYSGKVTTRDFEFSLPRARLTGIASVGGAPVGTGTVRYRQTSEKGNSEREAAIRTDGTFEIENLPSGDSELEVKVHLPRERQRTEKLTLKNGDNRAQFDFLPGDAALSATVPPIAKRLLRSLKVRVEVATPFGVDEFDYAQTPDKGDAFLIDGLPAGDAHVQCTLFYGDTGEDPDDWNYFVLASEFDLTLCPGEVADLPPTSGTCPIRVDVSHSGQANLFVALFEGSVTVPDLDQISMNDFEAFQRDHPPLLAQGGPSDGGILMEEWPQFMPGAYTLVVFGPGTSLQSEDEVMAGMRYAVLPVTMEAGKPAVLSVDLK